MVEIEKNLKIDTLNWYFLKFGYIFFKSNKRSDVVSEVLPIFTIQKLLLRRIGVHKYGNQS